MRLRIIFKRTEKLEQMESEQSKTRRVWMDKRTKEWEGNGGIGEDDGRK